MKSFAEELSDFLKQCEKDEEELKIQRELNEMKNRAAENGEDYDI